MNSLRFSGALFLGAAFAIPGISHAQPVSNEMPVVNSMAPVVNRVDVGPDSQTAQIKVRNVSSQLLAYWLDPMHQPKPIIQSPFSDENADDWSFGRDKMPRQPGNANGPLDLKLPPGVEIMGSLDPQNRLQVKGSKAGIDALQKLVTELDVPITQIEVDAQIWDMSPARLASLPLVFRDAASDEEKLPILGDVTVGNGGAKVGDGDIFTRTAFAAPNSDMTSIMQKLNEGIADGSARIINNPRTTVMDGLAAGLYSTESRALIFDNPPTKEAEAETTDNDDDNAPNSIKEDVDQWREGLTSVQSQTGFAAAPVLHGDVMNLGFRIIFINSVTSGSTIMRDGQTLAVRLPIGNIENGWPRVALIKAHIIRRAGEDEN